ncbi:MAG: c-type cytochrome biogenesis protein CcsB, partial [Smithellaceae bacterium]|nr:c-type cytochrome biogenesis protein CcsB [Smithellaceae bacterium]
MDNTIMFGLVTFIYLFSFFFYLVRMISGNEFWGRIGTWSTLTGFAIHTFAFGYRWVESYNMGIGRVPLSNFYESLVFFAWTIVLIYLIVEWRTKSRTLGTFMTPFAFIAMAFASLSPNIDSRIQPLIPALQSNWLTVHVITCFIGYAAFTVSCAMGIMYLLRRSAEKRSRAKKGFYSFLPSLEVADELNYQGAVLGFVFLTLGIMTGAIWAHSAWGTYWQWDPKETWSLVTWLIYA